MAKQKILITGGSGFIGTNLIDQLMTIDVEILNLDIAAPLSDAQLPYWKEIDILNPDALKATFLEFQPDWVMDLAARTDCDENTTVEAGYQLNIDGARNITEAIKACPSVSRVIFTSTQYVKRPGGMPEGDEDYDPHTVYGKSKILMEQAIRQATPPCTWTIIRPTNVWGPWHLRYRAQFFKVLRMGLYFHPGGSECVKSYAYVGNVADQIYRIFVAPAAKVNAKTFYVGDAPIRILDWVDAFSMKLTGHKTRVIPGRLINCLGQIGDVISIITGRPFLITTSRYNSMIENYLTPMDKTFTVLGAPRYSLEDGVDLTVAWLEAYDSRTH